MGGLLKLVTVMERLRKDGYPVRAIANPLQGLTSDTAYVSSGDAARSTR